MLLGAIIAGVIYFTDYNIPFIDDNSEFYVDSARENLSSENLNFTRFESDGSNNYVYFGNESSRLEVRVDNEGNIVSKEARYSPSDTTNEYVLTREEALNEAKSFLPGNSWEVIESERRTGNYVFELASENTYSRIWVDASEGDIVYYYRDFQSESEGDENYEDEDGRVED